MFRALSEIAVRQIRTFRRGWRIRNTRVSVMITVFGLDESTKLLPRLKKLVEKVMSSSLACRFLAKMEEILEANRPGEEPKMKTAVTDIHLVHGGFL